MTESITQFISAVELQMEFENYSQQRKLKLNKKILFDYRDKKLAFTSKQINVLKLVAKGYSNAKIAETLSAREAAVKLLIYRLIKYMEGILKEGVDRFSLVIIAQQLNFENC